MNEEMIQALAIATRIAFATITNPEQEALRACVDQACDIPAGFCWERKATAHAEFFTTLADTAGDLCVTPVLNHAAGFAYDLMLAAGRATDGIVINSRRRMLAQLRAGNADEAALEMEKHLRILNFMCRVATSPARASA